MAVVNEIALRRDAKIFCRDVEFLDREQLGKSVLRPAVKLSLMTFAVGVLGGKKAAIGVRQVAQNVIQNVADDFRVALVAADEKGVEVKLRELRIVIEHLLEMRHEPLGVHGVAREAAAKLVVNSPSIHAVASV